MSRRILLATFVLAALIVPLAVAQDNTNNQQGDRNRGGGGPGGGFDPAAMRERALGRIKEQMAVTNEEEWKVIETKLIPVYDKRAEALAGMFGGFGGRG